MKEVRGCNNTDKARVPMEQPTLKADDHATKSIQKKKKKITQTEITVVVAELHPVATVLL